MSKTTNTTRSRAPKSRSTVPDRAAMPTGLRHSDDSRPGYARQPAGKAFAFFDAHGKQIADANEIARINALVIPPAYTNVWICSDPRGHLQATGRDARGRKQYRYHPHWRETRDANKYERMAAFGLALPRIRARVARDIKRPGMPREKVVATVVHLLDTTLIRVGSEEYARENQSYGLTTLRKKHVKVERGRMRFCFRGKGGVEHNVTIDDARVKRIVRRCAELSGHDLFQYIDEDGERRSVGSADVNEYLQEVSHAGFTAKDYRTWAGSVLALSLLRRLVCSSGADAHRHIVATVKEVATQLRNTPAVCRRCYIHPAVLAAFEADELAALSPMKVPRRLRVEEAVFSSLLVKAQKPGTLSQGVSQGASDTALMRWIGKSRARLRKQPARDAAKRVPGKRLIVTA